MNKSTKISLSRGDKVYYVIAYFAAVLVALVTLYPLYFVLIASISDPNAVAAGEVYLLPRNFMTSAYERIFQYKLVWTSYLNSIYYTVFGTAINVTMTMIAAFVMSRRRLVGGKLITWMMLFTMYFGGGIIPTYLNIRSLKMLNTVWAMVLPGAISTYNLIVAKSFFEQSIPQELYESARLDGCGSLRTLISIVLPLSKAILAVLVLYYGVAHWNAYFNSLIYLRDSSKHPLQVVLRNILLLGQTEQMGSNDVGMGEKIKMVEAIKYSVIVVSSVPILLLYPLAQRYFVSGVMIGAVKG